MIQIKQMLKKNLNILMIEYVKQIQQKVIIVINLMEVINPNIIKEIKV